MIVIFGLNVPIWIFVLCIIAIVVILALLGLIIYGLVRYEKYPKTDIKKKYLFYIPARNEEKVIGALIQSIRNMNYDQSLIDICVLVNNSTDQTKTIVASLGEQAFEIDGPQIDNVGKVLSAYFDHVKATIGYDHYDAYVRLDADNLVDPNYLCRLNDAFVAKGGVLTTYRGVKNLNQNLGASLTALLIGQGMLAFRMFSGWKTNSIITGSGILMPADLLIKMDGWHFQTICEDMELSAYLVKKQQKVSFVSEAIFLDEHPTKLKYIFRQRLRWQAGRGQVFRHYWFSAIRSIFSPIWLAAIFMTVGLFPAGAVTIAITGTLMIVGIILAIIQLSWVPIIMFFVVPIAMTLAMGWLLGIVLMIVEGRRYKFNRVGRMLLAILIFPFSMFLQMLADFVRLFMKVTWKVIPREDIQ